LFLLKLFYSLSRSTRGIEMHIHAMRGMSADLYLLALPMACLGTLASAQIAPYPVKPVRIYAPTPGASGDYSARLIAPGLTAALGQQVIVDNRGGYGAIDALIKSAPDGHSLLVYGTTLWIVPLMERAAWDPQRDLAPVILLNHSPSTVVVHPSLPVRELKSLVNLAKARPGELNYGSAPAGSSQHLAAELFNAMARVRISGVPYKSSGMAQIGLMSGEVQVMFPPAGSVVPHVRSGRVRLLAVSSLKPSPFFPGVPSAHESGVPGYEVATVVALFAPSATPPVIVQKLNQETAAILSRAEIRQRFFSESMDAGGGAPSVLANIIKNEIARFGKLVQDMGLRNR
jgi:tripartite-type tricarboxylate transporter receptor subunit TctC